MRLKWELQDRALGWNFVACLRVTVTVDNKVRSLNVEQIRKRRSLFWKNNSNLYKSSDFEGLLVQWEKFKNKVGLLKVKPFYDNFNADCVKREALKGIPEYKLKEKRNYRLEAYVLAEVLPPSAMPKQAETAMPKQAVAIEDEKKKARTKATAEVLLARLWEINEAEASLTPYKEKQKSIGEDMRPLMQRIEESRKRKGTLLTKDMKVKLPKQILTVMIRNE